MWLLTGGGWQIQEVGAARSYKPHSMFSLTFPRLQRMYSRCSEHHSQALRYSQPLSKECNMTCKRRQRVALYLVVNAALCNTKDNRPSTLVLSVSRGAGESTYSLDPVVLCSGFVDLGHPKLSFLGTFCLMNLSINLFFRTAPTSLLFVVLRNTDSLDTILNPS